MKSFKQFSEATKVRGFPKGSRITTATVHRSDIEHATALASPLATADSKPYVEIHHNPEDRTFEIHTRKRDENGSPTGRTIIKRHDEGSFMEHVNKVMGRVFPDFHPPAKHLSMETNGKKFRFKLGR
jgi:hypothetical protein